MRILVDVNLSPEWVPFLRDRGFEALHWIEVGSPRAEDAELLTWARAHGYVVFTHGVAVGSLFAVARPAGPSAILVRTHDVRPSSIGDLVAEVARQHEGVIEQGALLTVVVAESRVRVLPLATP